MAQDKYLAQIIGERLRKKREAKGFSREKLAGIVHYHHNYIGEIERGEKLPTVNTLFNLATAVDTILAYFFEGIENEFQELKKKK